MIEKLTQKKYINLLIFLFMMVYFVSYITRINYGAVLVEVISEKGITKTAASWVVTGSSITYGIGQLISGYLGDKVKPQLLIMCGLATTAIMNIIFPFCSYAIMIGVWCINGFAQAMMWPPIVKMMTTYLTTDGYKDGSIKVSWGASFGTIAVYLVAPLLIGMSGWKSVFLICGSLAAIMIFVFNYAFKSIISHTEKVEEEIVQKSQTQSSKMSVGATLIFIFAMAGIGIILQGILRDGITTWMPTYVSEVYHLGSKISILTGVILPIFSIISYQVAGCIYSRWLRNEFVCAGVIFFVGFVCAMALSIAGNRSAILSVLLSALVTGCMHGVNIMLICMLPPYFEKFGKVSLISGALNSCTYIGAAISTYGMAVISDKFGWDATVTSWAVVAGVGTILCLVSARIWSRFKKEAIKEMHNV